MKSGYTSKTYTGSIEQKYNCILVDNVHSQNEVKNWHYRLNDAYESKNDGLSIGVWKIKNKGL